MDSPTGKTPSRRARVTVGAVVVLVVLGAAVAVVVASTGPRGQIQTVGSTPVPDSTSSPAPGIDPGGGTGGTSVPDHQATTAPGESGARSTVFVHILGEVVSPGLYELHDGDRAIDAVAAAGGLTDAADQTQLNLARFVSDGEQIIVPPIGQVPAPAPTDGAGAALPAAGATVNINTADAAALESLTGVGPALAGRIVSWRTENGNFAAIDDLLNVSGIGEKTLERFRADISV